MDSLWGMLLISWAPYIGLGAVALYVGGRYVRAIERRNTGRTELADVQDRLLRLEEAVADVSRDVDRVAEGQSFTTRILAERPSHTALPPDIAR